MPIIIHAKVSALADTSDPNLVQPSNWNEDHVIDYAEASDLAPVGNAPTAGSGTEIPRADHGHADSAAGKIYAATNFR